MNISFKGIYHEITDMYSKFLLGSLYYLGADIYSDEKPMVEILEKGKEIDFPKSDHDSLLLIHGSSNSHYQWFYTIDHLRNEYPSCRIFVVNLGRQDCSIPEYASFVKQCIRAIRERTGKNPLIVGTSMGGLVGSLAAEETEGEFTVVTINSPFQGVNWMPSCFRQRRYADMKKDSYFLNRLYELLKVSKNRYLFCQARHDMVVGSVPCFPPANSSPRSFKIIETDGGHTTMILTPQSLWKSIEKNLKKVH